MVAAIAAVLTACGSGAPEAARSAAPAPASPTAASPSATATASAPTTPDPTPSVQVSDFKVVAYQGDETFGGHDGHLAAAFAAGRPVVLLYYGGL